jgi:ubiquitin carboxyl-terminal hydrolase 14
MNALVQCLSKVQELKNGLYELQADPNETNNHTQLSLAAKQMYSDLDSKGESFPPYSFIQTLRLLHPQFDETDNQGRHMQQDSQECFNAMIRSFQNTNMRTTIADEDKNLINHLFDIDLSVSYTNTMSEDEERKESVEKVNMLSCPIDNQNKPIDHLMDGLKVNLEGEVESHSEHTNSTNVYKVEKRMNNLPPYLVVNMVRFFWKKESTTAGTQAGKAKILRQVSFPMVLDTFDLCSEELKKSLDHGRKYEGRMREEYDNKVLSGKIEEDARVAEEKKQKEKASGDVDMEEEKKNSAPKKQEKKVEATIKDEIVYRPHGTGLDTGKYHLVGVVTHQGRTADAGKPLNIQN